MHDETTETYKASTYEPKVRVILQGTAELTEAQMAKRGALLAEVLKLRRDREHPYRWQTTWGNKTDLGLFRIVERILVDGE